MSKDRQLCKLCRERHGDHVWQRGTIIGPLCGRCFYWLAANYKKDTGGKIDVLGAVMVIAGYASLRAGGFRVQTMLKVQAQKNHCSIDTIRKIARGRANLPLFESMRAAGITPPYWEK